MSAPDGTVAVEREWTLVMATVDVSDEYGVTVHQTRKRVEYTVDEARALAQSILQAAQDADAALQVDQLAARRERPLPHRFDIAPVCRDCAEGKHAACIGSTFVETSDDVAPDEAECGCAKIWHEVVGS